MRIPSCRHQREAGDNMAITPLIDCVFLLLIFFVCASAGQIRESLLPTELSAGASASPRAIEVEKPFGEAWLRLRRTEDALTTVEVEGRTFVDADGQFQSDAGDALTDFLKLLSETTEQQLPVILDIAPDVPVKDMVRAYDACRAANFQSIHFATDLR